MNRTSLLAIAAALVAAPMAFGHTDGGVYGTPKTYCETTDTNVHDYATNGASGAAYLLGQLADGNTQDCDGDGAGGDFDGHSEWSTGGAYLLSSDAGSTNLIASGATTCFGEGPHHGVSPNVWVFDHSWPSGVMFVVGADTSSLPTAAPTETDPTRQIDCGDGVDDVDTGYCLDQCTPGFNPGTDGAYHVFVVNEVEHDGLLDGPLVDTTQTSDQTDLANGVYCFNDPSDTDYWICAYANRNPVVASITHMHVSPPEPDPRGDPDHVDCWPADSLEQVFEAVEGPGEGTRWWCVHGHPGQPPDLYPHMAVAGHVYT